MTLHDYHRRHGFTLVEMLTVVSLIALLISILVPSLARARNQAKKAASAAAVRAIGTGVEMFHNAMDDYPDSRSIDDNGNDLLDPIEDYFNSTGQDRLSGAHWLTRALVGHDLQGVDTRGETLRGTDPPYLQHDNLKMAERQQLFLENSKIVLPDNDQKFRTGGDFVATGRPVMVDSWSSPILYYKANPRRQFPWTADSNGGVYNMPDNELITGNDQGTPAGWDFAAAGVPLVTPVHPLGVFSAYSDAYDPEHFHDPIPDGRKGQAFAGYLHDHAAGHTGGVPKAVKADSFILITPGEDRLYGTMDDVTNFQ